MPLSRMTVTRICCFGVLISTISCWVPFGRKVGQRSFGDIHNATSASSHAHFMNLALKQARNAEVNGEVPIGAVVVERSPDGTFNLLSAAYNLVETTHDASAHAELLALRKAAKLTKNWRLVNTTLYTTLEPCPMCLAAAQAFRVSSIVYGAPDLRLGAVKTHMKLLEVDHPYHTINEVVDDVLAEESASMLRDFFRSRRKNHSTQTSSPSLWARVKGRFS